MTEGWYETVGWWVDLGSAAEVATMGRPFNRLVTPTRHRAGVDGPWGEVSSGGPILSGIPYGYPGGPLGVVGLLRALATPAKVQVREEVGAVEGTDPADTGPVFFAGREVA